MFKLGRVTVGKVPRVVLVVQGWRSGLKRVKGVDILEARIDLFRSQRPSYVVSQVKKLARSGRPVIATIRSRREGGRARLSDAQRIVLYEAVLPWVHAVDVELASTKVVRAVKASLRQSRRKRTLILSHHNFKRTPPKSELVRLLKKTSPYKPCIFKIAARAKNADDVLSLYDFTRAHRSHGLITIAMGSEGAISRIVFGKAGSLLTYTSFMPFDGQVPLQPLVRSLSLLYG